MKAAVKAAFCVTSFPSCTFVSFVVKVLDLVWSRPSRCSRIIRLPFVISSY
jgi:hypothetical protein